MYNADTRKLELPTYITGEILFQRASEIVAKKNVVFNQSSEEVRNTYRYDKKAGP